MTLEITSEEILSRICDYFGTTPDHFLTDSRGEESIAFIRQAYTYLLWLYTDLPQSKIGQLTNRHQTSITTTIKLVRDRCLINRDYRKTIIELENMFE